MTPSNPDQAKPVPLWNVPNILTFSRIFMAIVIFGMIPFGLYKASLILFIVAALTDFVDGWWARKFNLKTKLGRITDAFADKVLVCGTFIYLVTIPELTGVHGGLAPWMVVVIVLRELLVTLLRSLVEGAGGDFSAKWVGKIKMGFQSITIPVCFLYLIFLQSTGTICPYLSWLMVATVWATVSITIYSGYIYIVAAIRFEKEKQD